VAVERDEVTASAYAALWPDDQVIVADAHAYLEQHLFDGWDFIWSSPPCQTHSRLNSFNWGHGRAQYPAIELWQEITLLTHALGKSHPTKWVVENVIPYYEAPLPPTARNLDRHYYWANFHIPPLDKPITKPSIIKGGTRTADAFNLEEAKFIYGIHPPFGNVKQQGQWLRNCIHPQIGRHIFNASQTRQQQLALIELTVTKPSSVLDLLGCPAIQSSSSDA